MTFAIIEQQIDGNGQATFDFGQPIGAYVYGIRKFSLESGTPGAALQDFGLSYIPADGTGVGYTQVTLQQRISAGLDPEKTSAVVAVLAFLGGSEPQDVLLGNQQGMPIGVSGSQLTPLSPPATSCAVLGGFSLLAVSETAGLDGIGAAVGMTCWPGTGATTYSPVGVAELIGDSAASGTIDIGHLIVGASQPGIWLTALSSDSPSSSFTVPVSDAADGVTVLVQSFYAQFDVSSEPIPDFISLTVGADGITAGNGVVTGVFEIDYQGQYSYWRSTYAGGWEATRQATVTVTAGSAIVVAVT